jgi:hypothetical protein
MIERDLPIFIIELAPYALAERGSSVEMLVENLLPSGYCFYCGPREKVLPKDPKLLSAIVPDWSSTQYCRPCRTEGSFHMLSNYILRWALWTIKMYVVKNYCTG